MSFGCALDDTWMPFGCALDETCHSGERSEVSGKLMGKVTNSKGNKSGSLFLLFLTWT